MAPLNEASWEFLLIVFYPFTVIKTSFFFLCIFPDSQSFTSKPNSPVYQLKGQSASLSWNFNRNGKTVSQVLWFHNNNWVATKPSNGQPSFLSARYQVSEAATLRISNVQTQDNGDFDCQVYFTNSVPPVIKDTAQLVVVGKFLNQVNLLLILVAEVFLNFEVFKLKPVTHLAILFTDSAQPFDHQQILVISDIPDISNHPIYPL